MFQTGISWEVVESKWPESWQAFRGFDQAVVTNLIKGRRVVRNRRKLDVIAENPRRMAELEEHHRRFQGYLPRRFRETRVRPAKAVPLPDRHGRIPLPVCGARGSDILRGLVRAPVAVFPRTRGISRGSASENL